MLVSILIPCYNEKHTIEKLIFKVKKQKKIKKQIILVDDGSTDGTSKIIKSKLKSKVDKVIFHKKNLGKGSSIISAQKFIKGDIIIIQDADLEYEPSDYYKLLKPFKNKLINVVYGSRVLGRKQNINEFSFEKKFRIFGNFVLTKISNLLNRQDLTDVHTCYKLLRKNIFFKLKLEEKDFSFCSEVTTKLSKLNENIIEVPIKYNGRSYIHGKKISFKDAILTIITIFKYKILFKDTK
jgi:dolichol-phosphate mannosyltransferase